MFLKVAILLALAMAVVVERVSGADSRKLPIPKAGSRSQDPLYNYLVNGCKKWEGNCDRKFKEEGSCDKKEVICKDGYYRCPENDPDAPCCIDEKHRPFTCPTPATGAPSAAPNTTLASTSQRPSSAPPSTAASAVPAVTSSASVQTVTPANSSAPPPDSSTSSPNTSCPPNEIYNECPKCAQWVCKDVRPPQKGDRANGVVCGNNDTHCGPPGCFCNMGYARNHADICVPIDKCNETNANNCSSNSYWDACPKCHDAKCEEIVEYHPESSGLARGGPGPLSHPFCLAAGCRCNEGFARDSAGKCAKVIGKGACQK